MEKNIIHICGEKLFDIFCKYDAIIYGKHLMKILSGARPYRLDCVLDDVFFEKFSQDIENLEYELVDIKRGLYIYNHPNLIQLNVLVDMNPYENPLYIQRLWHLDIHVNNMLWTWDKDSHVYMLDLWAAQSDRSIVSDAIYQKDMKVVYVFHCKPPYKFEKILIKGFTAHRIGDYSM